MASRFTVSGSGTAVCDSGRLGALTVRAASVIGSKHSTSGALREDAYGFCKISDSDYLFAVADGLSSTRNAHMASALAVHVALRAFPSDDRAHDSAWVAKAHHTFTKVADALVASNVDRLTRDLWSAHGESSKVMKATREPATTLVLARVHVRQDGSGILQVAGVGDCVAVWSPPGQPRWTFALPPASKEGQLTNATDALPRSSSALRTDELSLEPGSSILLCSDGLAETFTPGFRDDADPDLAHGWSAPPDMLTFLRDIQIPLRGCVDDRTAVAAWLPLAEVRSPE